MDDVAEKIKLKKESCSAEARSKGGGAKRGRASEERFSFIYEEEKD